LSPSCKDPAEPLTLDEIADRCHCPEDVSFASAPHVSSDHAHLPASPIVICIDWLLTHALRLLPQIEMIYKIIQHMAANDRALIAEGSCGSPCSVKVYLGECNVDEDMQAA